MKKIALGIVLLVLGGVLVAPKLIGDRAHQVYLKAFSEYPLKTSGISFEQKSYEQSWFSSRAVTVIKIPVGSPEVKSVSVVLTSNIEHGPVIFTGKGLAFGLAYVKSNITLAGLPAGEQNLVDKYLPEGTITSASLIDFNKLSHDTMHVGSIHFEGDKDSSVFGGLNLTGESRLDYSSLKGTFDLPASHFTADGFALDIADASGSYDEYKHADMMLGKSDLNFPRINLVAKTGTVTLEDFKVVSNSEDQSGKLNMTGGFGVQKITAPIPVTAFQYDIEMNRVDPKVIELWSEIAKGMQTQATAKPTAMAIPWNTPKLHQLLELLLHGDPEMNQQLTLDGMGGRLSVNWDTHFVRMPEGEHIDDKMDGTKLLKAMDMRIGVNVDEKVAMATPFAKMLTPYMQRGMIVKRGQKLVADIKFSKGVLTVNGIPVPMGKTQQSHRH